MKTATLKTLWQQPLFRAALIHLALLGGGWGVARLIASALGLSVSLLGILLAYGVVNIALTAWLLRRKTIAESENEIDETADALASFAEEPLGALIGDAKARLAMARKHVGRQTAMYQPLDRLVRTTRKIERRLALEPDLRAGFSRSLTRHLPLIATTAEQYVQLKDKDASDNGTGRVIVAEGVLREAADRLEQLAESEGKIDGPMIGLLRMDANAEVLAEQMSADTDSASRRAAALRASHALRQAMKSVEPEQARALRDAALQIDTLAADGGDKLTVFVSDEAEGLIAAAEAVAVAEDTRPAEALLRRTSRLRKTPPRSAARA